MKKIVMLMLLGPTVAHAAGRVVYHDFESGSSIGKCAIGSSAFDGGHAYAGNGMAICNWDGVLKAADWSDPLADITFDVHFPYNNEFLIRFKQRADNDYDTNSAGAKWLRFGETNTIFQLDNNEMHWNFCTVGATGCDDVINKWSVPMADDIYSRAWHEWTIYYRNGSNGRVVVWLNGQVMGEYSGDMGTVSHSPVSFGSNWSVNSGWEHDADNHRYIDEVEIYSDTGSGASGSMEAGTITQSGNTAPPPALPEPNSAPSTKPTPAPIESVPVDTPKPTASPTEPTTAVTSTPANENSTTTSGADNSATEATPTPTVTEPTTNETSTSSQTDAQNTSTSSRSHFRGRHHRHNRSFTSKKHMRKFARLKKLRERKRLRAITANR